MRLTQLLSLLIKLKVIETEETYNNLIVKDEMEGKLTELFQKNYNIHFYEELFNFEKDDGIPTSINMKAVKKLQKKTKLPINIEMEMNAFDF